jgi:hypothetical protein
MVQTSYTIYISKSEKSGYKKVETVSSKKTSYTVSKYNKKALKKGTTYYIKIVPNAKIGKKTRSSEVYQYWPVTI